MCFIVAGNDTLGMENKHIQWLCYMVLSWGRGNFGWFMVKARSAWGLMFLYRKKYQIRKATCWCHFLNTWTSLQKPNETKNSRRSIYSIGRQQKSWLTNVSREWEHPPEIYYRYRTKRSTFLFHQLAGNMNKFYLAWSSVCHNNTTLHLFHSLPALY